MLANPTREVRIDQFTDFAHDFHPQRLDVEQRLACLIPEGGFSVCDRNHGCALSGARHPAGFAFFPPIPFGLSPKDPAHPWEKPRSAIIRNLNAAALEEPLDG